VVPKVKILIVGAGAGGLITGYHFALSGIDVTFFVRPSRMDEMAQKPKRLYCYNDHKVKLFDEYATLCDMDDVAAKKFDYVLTTLDGNAMHSDEGMALLGDLGNAVRESNSILVCLGAAHGIEEFFVKQTGHPIERCLFGSFSLLSHNVPLPDQRFEESIDQEALAGCVFAYTHLGKGNGGLVLTRTNRDLGKELAEVYGRSGVSSCMVMPNLRVMDCMSYFLAPSFVAFEIEGWPEPDDIYETESWRLAEKATMELFALPQHGLSGKVVAALGGPLNMLTKMFKNMSRDASPLDFHAFNKFHHGGKVVEQDISLARDALSQEEGRGRKLPNLRSLMARLDKVNAQKNKA